MLLPRFSIRTLLAIVVAVAIASLFAGQAISGRTWAVGVTVALASVPVALAVHALFFLICSAMARVLGAQETVARTSRGGVERSVSVAPRAEQLDAAPSAGSQPTAP